MSRLQAWMNEREALASELRRIADSLFEVPLPRRSPTSATAEAQGALTPQGGMISSGRAAKKRTMSPEARAKIAEAQRRRWAAQKQSGGARKAKKAKSD